jgi:hypothetical protein
MTRLSGLPQATNAAERYQPRAREQRLACRDLAFAADEGGELLRQTRVQPAADQQRHALGLLLPLLGAALDVGEQKCNDAGVCIWDHQRRAGCTAA